MTTPSYAFLGVLNRRVSMLGGLRGSVSIGGISRQPKYNCGCIMVYILSLS